MVRVTDGKTGRNIILKNAVDGDQEYFRGSLDFLCTNQHSILPSNVNLTAKMGH